MNIFIHVLFSVISVEQWPRTDPFNEPTTIRKKDILGGTVSSLFARSQRSTNSHGRFEADKHLVPKKAFVTAKGRNFGARCTEHNAGELTQADVLVVAAEDGLLQNVLSSDIYNPLQNAQGNFLGRETFHFNRTKHALNL